MSKTNILPVPGQKGVTALAEIYIDRWMNKQRERDTDAEVAMLCPPDEKSQPTGKDFDAGKD